ncbi:MAG: HK97 gp10 family phage protein [Bacteroidales bacterium]|jgi:hypothetical protein|nr:HK97 gp10 family phage protein [Bacteroidales bacterium]
MYSVKLRGLDEFARALRQGNARALPAFKAAMVGTAQEAGGAIKDRTPVQTGRLRASIRHFMQNLAGWVVTDVHYAGYVEFGTAKMAPRGYFKRGIDAAMPRIQELWKQAMVSLWR